LGCAVEANDVIQSDFFIGLAITDTAILGGVTDSVGFRKVDAAATVASLTEKDSNEETDSDVGTWVVNTLKTLELYWDGNSVEFFVDGVSQASHSTTIPDNEALRLSLEWLTGEAVAQTMKFQFLRVIQIGR
jgi:hypothetical protein